MQRSEQLTFDLPKHRALGLDDFMVSPANQDALDQIMEWQDWSIGKLLLTGPQGCGKTHLASVWAEKTGAVFCSRADLLAFQPDALPAAVVIDDCDGLVGPPEIDRALFHLFNATKDAQIPVLFTAINPSSRWTVGLPDLASRMALCDVAKLSQPDDKLLGAVTAKQFLDRQLNVKPEVVTFIVRRIDRSFAASAHFVERLDRAALRTGRAITIPFVRDILGGDEVKN